MTLPTFQDVREADRYIQKYIHRTPILTSQLINQRCGGNLFFKCENFQKVGAFKIRGATNAIRKLTDKQKSKGVVTHSSGNHGQAVALAARKQQIDATIVIPENAPPNKVEAVKNYGADVHFCASTQQAREEETEKIIEKTGATFVHSYNNKDVIAGQGTLGYELFKEIGDVDKIIAPVGGGGLLSGISLAVKHIRPEIEVIGAEPVITDDARRSFYEGKIVQPDSTDTIADGLRTSLGDLTFEIIRENVDDIVTVEESTIIEAMRFIWERMKILIEPSSAVPLASILEGNIQVEDQRVVLIVSGGNANLDDLPWIQNR